MAISAINTVINGGNVASLGVNVPTGTLNGHIMLAFVVAEGTVTPPAGWTSVTSEQKLHLYWRVAASEPASYTWATSVNGIAVNVTTYSGAARVAKESIGLNTTGLSSVDSNAIVIAHPGAWLVIAYSKANTGTITMPGGLTPQGGQQSDGVAAIVAVGTVAQSATTAACTKYTASGTAATWGVITIGLQPGIASYAADTTNNGRILSQIIPGASAATFWDAYTVPAGANAIVNSIVAANIGGAPDTISVSVAIAGAIKSSKQNIYTTITNNYGTTLVLTSGITLQAGDVIRVNSLNRQTAFSIFGQEVTSGDNGKVLGQAFPAAATLTTLYTVPSSGINWTSASCLLVSNQSSTPDYFRVSIQVGGATDDPSQYLCYDVQIAAYNTFELTIGIPLSLTDVVKVRSLNGNCSFNLFGSEVQAA